MKIGLLICELVGGVKFKNIYNSVEPLLKALAYCNVTLYSPRRCNEANVWAAFSVNTVENL